LLEKFVGDCVPQPDGSNLLPYLFKDDPALRTRYWEERQESKSGLSGMKANELFQARQGQARVIDPSKVTPMDPSKPPMGPGPKRPPMGMGPGTGDTKSDVPANELPPFISDLIQVNIESVDSRFCDDLDGFWTYLRKSVVTNESDVHPLKMANKSPAASKDKK